ALHCFLTSAPAVPMVGASGAISGVMAAYAVLFPRTRLVSVLVLFKVRLRAVTYLGIWLGFQFVGALSHEGGIAWWAHIGGFLTGAAAALVMRPALPRASAAG